jgi:hypothetical protein
MNKSIIELIASEQSAKAVAVVEKALGKKLLKAISEQAVVVARNTYGTLQEAFGPDEQPEFMNPSDNTYAVFFANALKKFGVNGPEDFRDEATKKQFFQYVDNNWKAQDSVQGIASQAPPAPTMDQGTGTQLPATAPFNQPPQMPMQPGSDTTSPAQMGGGGNPSLGNMSASGGPDASVMNPQGDDPGLDAMGKSQNSYGSGTCQSCGQAMPEPQTCQACGQTIMPGAQGGMPGQPMPGQQVQPGADMGDDDSDPDLEIGDSDQVDGDDDQFGQDSDDDQNGGFGDSDVDGDENGDQGDFVSGGDDENGDAGGEAGFGGGDAAMQDGDGNVDDEQGDGEAENEDDDEDGDDDDPFNDEDAYSVSPNDFSSDDDPDGDGIPDDEDPDDQDDEDGDPDLEIGDDDDEDDDDDDQFGGDDDSDDVSDVPDEDDGDSDEDDDEDDDSDDEDDDDPYDDEDDSDDDEVVLAPSKKAKNPFAKNENFGFKEDNDADRKFITEVLDPMIQKSSGDPGLHRKLKGAKNDLRQIMHSRNKHFSMLKHRRREILNDHEKSPKQKRRAVKYISQLAKRHKAHCAQQAQGVKALHTGKY